MTRFEDHLWAELVRRNALALMAAGPGVAGSRSPTTARRRPRRVLFSAAGLGLCGAAAAITLALLPTTATTPQAYAVTLHPKGYVTVTIRQISAVKALNARLARLGIRARAVPIVPVCSGHLRAGVLFRVRFWIGFPVTRPPKRIMIPRIGLVTLRSLTFEATAIPRGQTLVLAAKQIDHRVALTARTVRGPVPACVRAEALLSPRR